MSIEIFFTLLELFSGAILLCISIWAFLSFKLKSFKTAFEVCIISSIFLINAIFFSMAEIESVSKALFSIAIFLLSISFALLINAAKHIGLGR